MSPFLTKERSDKLVIDPCQSCGSQAKIEYLSTLLEQKPYCKLSCPNGCRIIQANNLEEAVSIWNEPSFRTSER